VEYKCNKCGNTHFEELPKDDAWLSKLLTQWVADMPEEKRLEIFAQKRLQQEEFARHRQKMLDEMAARDAARKAAKAARKK
jgi:hypothetical protein